MNEDTQNQAQGKRLAAFKIDEQRVQSHLDGRVRDTVEQTLNQLLDQEAAALCNAKKHQRSPERQDTRAGHYQRKLQTKAGAVTLNMPKRRPLPFETQIIERCKHRESSVEEALVEMYLAGVSLRRVEDTTEALWGTRVSPSTVSALNQKIGKQIETWRNRPIEGEHPYVYLDGIWLKRSWGGEVKNVSVRVAVSLDQDGCREVLGVVEGAKEDYESWLGFLRHLKERGLNGMRLVISDTCVGLVEALGEVLPDAAWQRCMTYFQRNVTKQVPSSKLKEVTAMLKAIHAQEDQQAAQKKADDVVEKLEAMKLPQAAQIVREGVTDPLTYMRFPREHRSRIRTNNPLERVMKEIRRRTQGLGAFPDSNSALMRVAARLRHGAAARWAAKRYMDLDRLYQQERNQTGEAMPPAASVLFARPPHGAGRGGAVSPLGLPHQKCETMLTLPRLETIPKL
jgi:transposase-like protein